MADEIKTESSLLAEFGFESPEAAAKALRTYKEDVKTLKDKVREYSGIEQEYRTLKEKDESERLAKLTEADKHKEMIAKLQKDLEDKDNAIKQVEKKHQFDLAVMNASQGKPFAKTRSNLYGIAANNQEWNTPEELAEIFKQVDAEFEDELKSAIDTKKIPAPGDLGGFKGLDNTGKTAYDANYFKGLAERHKNK